MRGEGSDGGQYAFRIFYQFMVPEADHAIAFAFEEGGAGRVCRFFMLAAVQFDDQAGGMRG
ncbi:hypothetical protein YP76_10965 [Sphingobium chungbukense]|uniref:Uncharacterized protein n=1 Tax=Sphingobium chungbukense TaxID=56193 RepID=A0A0M3AV22_9SPHN|nr:hypothetical protein YP76_10965 [Sphingobium chungbukense]